MRIRVTEKLTGEVDGIALARFTPGYVYDVGVSLGSYLLAMGAVEPVADDTPALVWPLDTQFFGVDRRNAADPPPPVKPASEPVAEGSPELRLPIAEATDRPPRRRRRKSR